MVAHAKGEILYETQTKPILATPERVSNVKQPYKMDNNDNDMSPPPASDYLDQKQLPMVQGACQSQLKWKAPECQ